MFFPMMKKPCQQHSPWGAFLLGGALGLGVVGIVALCKTRKGKQMMQKAKQIGESCLEKCEEACSCLQTQTQNGGSKDTAEAATAFYSTNDDVPHPTSSCYCDDVNGATFTTPQATTAQDIQDTKKKNGK
ncbi:MAG: hypothetical protein J6K61_04410 [Clostridia bacterium]|nr:hypothetical protein [Clostridia bacterium]